MTAFLGTVATCGLLAIASLVKWHPLETVYLLFGSLLYLFGTVGATIVCNAPLNDALAIASPDSMEGANQWANYLTDWTFWNHVRTIAALVAAALFSIALCKRG